MTAIVYLRNIVTPLLLFQICMLAFALTDPAGPGADHSCRSFSSPVVSSSSSGARNGSSLTNGYAYWERSAGPNYVTMAYDKKLADTGIVATGLLDSFRISLFNSPLFADYDLDALRLFGPNMHAISFAYALCFFAIFALYRGHLLLSTAALSCCWLLTSAKGPLILFLLVGASWLNFKLFGAKFAFLPLPRDDAYAAMGIVVGTGPRRLPRDRPYGGFDRFLGQPDRPRHRRRRQPVGGVRQHRLARRAGAGARLSRSRARSAWFSQTGVFAIAIIGAYIWVAWRLLIARTTGNDLHAAASFALLTTIGTGLFQEEAYFAPLALGHVHGARRHDRRRSWPLGGSAALPSPRQRFLEVFLVR